MTVGIKPKVAIGQAGGPTAVINASLVGFLEAAKSAYTTYGVVNACQGLVNDWIYEIDDDVYGNLSRYRHLPGAALGSGRWAMTEEDFHTAVHHLKRRDIHLLVLIGGNGTMYACQEMARAADKLGYDLAVAGIPKTVDNDLMETDHTPGYGSAARYVAATVRDIGEDLKSMRNFESVRIMETMGRNVGWLTAASMLLKESEEQPPHLIYVPERAFELDEFLQDVEQTVSRIGHAAVVISEGLRDRNGELLSKLTLHEKMTNTVLGGASRFLADQVSARLNLPSRAEMLGMNQRCFSSMVSNADRREAEALGAAAAELLLKGESGRMVTLVREELPDERYAYRPGSCRLEAVAGIERLLPADVVNERGTAISPAFKNWLRSLTGDDLQSFPDWSFHRAAST
ncbi:diphosphate--fructose-6-phosphate 1-phosphotransferase [Cohnella hongkongensis]|uniref:Pyrophosphate--fructose 6-phosphate 1-phosphotransferase n=1 Tax=Cohnella hongkongensis TaxID=178337 RepID=A0ABV9F955_9BACL